VRVEWPLRWVKAQAGLGIEEGMMDGGSDGRMTIRLLRLLKLMLKVGTGGSRQRDEPVDLVVVCSAPTLPPPPARRTVLYTYRQRQGCQQ